MQQAYWGEPSQVTLDKVQEAFTNEHGHVQLL